MFLAWLTGSPIDSSFFSYHYFVWPCECWALTHSFLFLLQRRLFSMLKGVARTSYLAYYCSKALSYWNWLPSWPAASAWWSLKVHRLLPCRYPRSPMEPHLVSRWPSPLLQTTSTRTSSAIDSQRNQSLTWSCARSLAFNYSVRLHCPACWPRVPAGRLFEAILSH